MKGFRKKGISGNKRSWSHPVKKFLEDRRNVFLERTEIRRIKKSLVKNVFIGKYFSSI
jgi:hypothetical protein